MFLAQRCELSAFARGRGISEKTLDLFRSGERLGETLAEAQVVLPYFWRKRSTRPAVSINFCFPV